MQGEFIYTGIGREASDAIQEVEGLHMGEEAMGGTREGESIAGVAIGD